MYIEEKEEKESTAHSYLQKYFMYIEEKEEEEKEGVFTAKVNECGGLWARPRNEDLPLQEVGA